jgi:hypothetical protein
MDSKEKASDFCTGYDETPDETGVSPRRWAIVVTPRRIVWVLLLGGVVWFVTISPKTPLQFFDAANRDDAASDSLSDMSSEQSASPRVRLYRALSSLIQEKHRIELSYDMINDPARVQRCRASIMHGVYLASPQTREMLVRNNGAYKAILEQIKSGRFEMLAAEEAMANTPDPKRETQEDADQRARHFQTLMDRMLLRQFQAKLFWWGR